jgi:hypothetical protein
MESGVFWNNIVSANNHDVPQTRIIYMKVYKHNITNSVEQQLPLKVYHAIKQMNDIIHVDFWGKGQGLQLLQARSVSSILRIKWQW